MRRSTPIHILLALGTLAPGCSHPATQVLVYFHAEPALRSDAARIRVTVEGPEGEVSYDQTHDVVDGPAGVVARVPLVPRDGDATRVFRIRGVLLGADGAELARVEAGAGYVADELREIRLWLGDDCRGVDCGDGRTCDRGVCVGACYVARPTGELSRSEPACGECQQCFGGSCEPFGEEQPCGCAGTDSCHAGECVTRRPVVQVYTGEQHTCAGLREGDVYCWGSDRVGQLGTDGGSVTAPAHVPQPYGANGTVGDDHTCWLTWMGTRACWGWNGAGQLGLGTLEARAYDVPTPGPDGEPSWTAIDSGWSFLCASTSDHRIYCWGSNNRGQAGLPPGDPGATGTPTPIDDGTDWDTFDSAGHHTCAIKQDGSLWCWGMDVSGELGQGESLTEGGRPDPVRSGCIGGRCYEDWEVIAAGNAHTCAIRAGGELWCWGGGRHGQLGIGELPTDSYDRPTPQRVGDGWRFVAGGGSLTCGIRADGTLWCWGANERGQLGTGDFRQRWEPARVRAPGGDEWRTVGPGRFHTCAIRTDGTLWCWGLNTDAQLGLGFASPEEGLQVSTPRRVCFPP